MLMSRRNYHKPLDTFTFGIRYYVLYSEKL
jgi:hypothetical protein